MKAFVLIGSLVFSQTALAQPTDFPAPRTDGAQTPAEPEPPMPRYVHQDRYFGAHLGVNVGLIAFDLQVNKFYAYVAAGAGVTLLTNNRFGAFAAGLGYSVKLRDTTRGRWQMDMMLMVAPGWTTGGWPMDYTGSRQAYVGVGVGVGFRYEFDSGFSVGFKIPVFGYAIAASTANNSASGVGLYYVASGAALPIISFGYRF